MVEKAVEELKNSGVECILCQDDYICDEVVRKLGTHGRENPGSDEGGVLPLQPYSGELSDYHNLTEVQYHRTGQKILPGAVGYDPWQDSTGQNTFGL